MTCLAAGRDLLATHFTTSDDGALAPLSRWGPVIRSAAVTGALLERTGRLARHLTNWASKASYAAVYHSAQPGTAIRELDGGRYWLTLADTILTGSRQRRPVTAADRTLLAAIPASGAPERQRPARPEPQPVLCEAITATAARLRAAARWQPDQAAWSPLVSAESFRWCAQANAIVTDVSELLLTTLAERAPHLAGLPPSARRTLTTASAAAASACTTWRHAASAWKELTRRPCPRDPGRWPRRRPAPAPPGGTPSAPSFPLPSSPPGRPLAAFFSDDLPNASLASAATFAASAPTWPSRSAIRTRYPALSARSATFSAASTTFSARSRPASARQPAAPTGPGCCCSRGTITAGQHDHQPCVQHSGRRVAIRPRPRKPYGITEYLRAVRSACEL